MNTKVDLWGLPVPVAPIQTPVEDPVMLQEYINVSSDTEGSVSDANYSFGSSLPVPENDSSDFEQDYQNLNRFIESGGDNYIAQGLTITEGNIRPLVRHFYDKADFQQFHTIRPMVMHKAFTNYRDRLLALQEEDVPETPQYWDYRNHENDRDAFEKHKPIRLDLYELIEGLAPAILRRGQRTPRDPEPPLTKDQQLQRMMDNIEVFETNLENQRRRVPQMPLVRKDHTAINDRLEYWQKKIFEFTGEQETYDLYQDYRKDIQQQSDYLYLDDLHTQDRIFENHRNLYDNIVPEFYDLLSSMYNTEQERLKKATYQQHLTQNFENLSEEGKVKVLEEMRKPDFQDKANALLNLATIPDKEELKKTIYKQKLKQKFENLSEEGKVEVLEEMRKPDFQDKADALLKLAATPDPVQQPMQEDTVVAAPTKTDRSEDPLPLKYRASDMFTRSTPRPPSDLGPKEEYLQLLSEHAYPQLLYLTKQFHDGVFLSTLREMEPNLPQSILDLPIQDLQVLSKRALFVQKELTPFNKGIAHIFENFTYDDQLRHLQKLEKDNSQLYGFVQGYLRQAQDTGKFKPTPVLAGLKKSIGDLITYMLSNKYREVFSMDQKAEEDSNSDPIPGQVDLWDDSTDSEVPGPSTKPTDMLYHIHNMPKRKYGKAVKWTVTGEPAPKRAKAKVSTEDILKFHGGYFRGIKQELWPTRDQLEASNITLRPQRYGGVMNASAAIQAKYWTKEEVEETKRLKAAQRLAKKKK